MKSLAKRVLWVAFLMSPAFEALACPACANNRLLQSYWHAKVIVFYRSDGKKGFLLWQPFAYCAVLFITRACLGV